MNTAAQSMTGLRFFWGFNVLIGHGELTYWRVEATTESCRFASLVVGSVSVVLGLQGSPVFVVQKWTDKEERHVTGNMSAMFVLRSCSCSRIDNLLGDDMDYAFIVVVVDNKFNHK